MQNGLEYLEDHPDAWRWMNRCPACGVVGHKPELPERDTKHDDLDTIAKNLRSLFPCLQLRDDGRCDRCHAKTDRWQPRADSFGMDE